MLPYVNTVVKFKNVNIIDMLNERNYTTDVDDQQHSAMTKPINPAVVGAFVRKGRNAAGLTQTQLAERIGASRFWVAAFEKGKPSAELGLALKAVQALGLSIRIESDNDNAIEQASRRPRVPLADRSGYATLANIIAQATLTHTAPSQVVGWPGVAPTRGLSTVTRTRRKKS